MVGVADPVVRATPKSSAPEKWPLAAHAHLPSDTRLNVLFGSVPGFAMNPMYLLELPVTVVLSVMFRQHFRWRLLGPMFALYVWKEMACMSLSLHRYFSHKGFKCNRVTQFGLYWLGCLASQGPPLWWASKHRRHHATCDTAEDPHSPVAHGSLYAWLGWTYIPGKEGPHGRGVDEEFVQELLRFPELAYAENLHVVPVAVNHALFYCYGGLPYALFVSMWSGILCQVLTMYFNVAFHLPEHPTADGPQVDGACHARDLPFDPLSQIFGEAFHRWHHRYPRAMLRPGIDLPYWLMIKPMLLLGVFQGANIMGASSVELAPADPMIWERRPSPKATKKTL